MDRSWANVLLVSLAGCAPTQPARAPVDYVAETNRCQATLTELTLQAKDCPEAQAKADAVLKADPHCKLVYPDGKIDVCKLVK